MLATVSSLLASPGAKKGRREAPVSLGMGRDAPALLWSCQDPRPSRRATADPASVGRWGGPKGHDAAG